MDDRDLLRRRAKAENEAENAARSYRALRSAGRFLWRGVDEPGEKNFAARSYQACIGDVPQPLARSRGVLGQETPPSVDVIIPTYHPDQRTIWLVHRLLNQTYEVNRIYLINSKTEHFPVELTEFGEKVIIRHIPKREFDHGGTRHQAAMESKADVVVFMTQDAVPVNERMIEELLAPFVDASVGIVYGRQIPCATANEIERYTRGFNYPPVSRVKSLADLPRLGIKTFFCSNVCSAYRKDLYESLGGFESRIIFNEDMIMAAKLLHSGYKVAYAAAAKVLHSHNDSYLRLLKRNFDLGVSQTEYPEIFSLVNSKGEGVKLVRSSIKHLWDIRKPWLIPSLLISSGFKWLGYGSGRRYHRLPKWLVKRCSMNNAYWG